MKSKKQESAKWSREMAVVEKKKREKEVEMNKLKPLFIKAKEQTLHVVKRLEASKYVSIENVQYMCMLHGWSELTSACSTVHLSPVLLLLAAVVVMHGYTMWSCSCDKVSFD